MPEFLITGPDGSKYKITGPEGSTPEAALQFFRSTNSGTVQQQAIPQGDWGALKERLDIAENKVKDSGPYRPQDVKAYREAEAGRQGRLYGKQYGQDENSAGIFGGAATNTYALGLPRYLEALTNPSVPVAQAHEFLKGADAGRAEAAPIATTAGKVAGYAGQALTLPVSGAATVGGRAVAAMGQGGTLGLAEQGIESRGDPIKMLTGGAAGALTGGVASYGMDKAIQAGRAIIDPLRGLAKSGPAEQQASARLLLAAKNAGIDDATAQRKLAELGPEGFIADVLGKQGQSLARTSANLSPEARSLLENSSSGRIAGQQDRLIEALQGGTALPGATIKEAQAAAYEAAKPSVKAAYAKAGEEGFANPINWPDWIKNTPMVQEAIRAAQADTRNRVGAFGSQEGSQFAVLDAARQWLATKGFQEGNPTAKALANKLNGFIDDNVASAAEARKLAQGYKQEQAALEVGGNLARTRPAPDALAAARTSTNPAQVEQGYLIGKINEINQRAPGKRTVDLVDNTPMQREALLAALSSRAGNVTRQTNAERKFLEFDNALKGNSTTARQLIEMGVFGGAGAAGGYLTGFDPMAAGSVAGLAALGKTGGKKLIEALAARNEAAVAPEVARKLIERSLPKLVDKEGKPITETARRRLVEALLRDATQGATRAGSGQLVPAN